MRRILSPNFVVGVLTFTAIIGIVLAIVGMAADVRLARTVGLLLIAPVVIGGILLVVAVFPILIIANRRHQRSDNEQGSCNENEQGS